MIGREDNVASHTVSAWRGIAFEELCFAHIGQIKKALGIFGVSSRQSSFTVKGDGETEGMQILTLYVAAGAYYGKSNRLGLLN